MTLRDLTEEERNKLMKKCASMFDLRNQARRDGDLHKWADYKVAFSDGVQQALKMFGTHTD